MLIELRQAALPTTIAGQNQLNKSMNEMLTL